MAVKVFISQPMAGRTARSIADQRDALLDYAERIFGECREVPSWFGPRAAEQMPPLELLGKSIKLMAHADVAVFAPGWESARGCRIEHACAVDYGVQVIEVGDPDYFEGGIANGIDAHEAHTSGKKARA